MAQQAAQSTQCTSSGQSATDTSGLTLGRPPVAYGWKKLHPLNHHWVDVPFDPLGTNEEPGQDGIPVGDIRTCSAHLGHAVVQAEGVAQGEHLLPHQQVGRAAHRDWLQLGRLLLRALQLQDRDVLVWVPRDELRPACDDSAILTLHVTPQHVTPHLCPETSDHLQRENAPKQALCVTNAGTVWGCCEACLSQHCSPKAWTPRGGLYPACCPSIATRGASSPSTFTCV